MTPPPRSTEIAKRLMVAHLQQVHARRRWAKVHAFMHAFVKVYSYTIFLQKHVYKKMYLPGGKVGKRSRDGFEVEFGLHLS